MTRIRTLVHYTNPPALAGGCSVFAQLEAAETIIFLVEATAVYQKNKPLIPLDKPGGESLKKGFSAFVRYALKMATGTGKTTVMGMLSAWSILNRVASPTDDRFPDTILIVCPNVTIRERLQELNPALGDLSLYRTRQLVPVHRMEELRRCEVMIANWLKLAKKETNSVNGDSAKVVKMGVATKVVVNAGRKDERIETKYFESDKAWFKRIRQELGTGKGRCPHWLIFNDEAHHAYRRGDNDSDIMVDLEEDTSLAKKNAKEATIWIEGLDRINKLAGAKKKGIHLCVDLSATPFYIQGSGNEVTVRVDSKVVEELEEGGTKDETKRLRFILDTVGKKTWLGGKVPEDWSELIRKNNDKAASDDNDGTFKWMDELIPPGRNIRCIISVSMLSEGWDANTVTHVVGLRPFGSQLLCEQVVGRVLRRRSYALNEV